MRANGPWKRRGLAIAAIMFTLSTVALEIASPVGAAPSPTGIAVNPRPARQVPATGPAVKAKAKTLATPKALAKAKAKAKRSPLSLPELFLLAIAPFVVMGAYLLGSDSLRNRTPKKHHPSLIITRVSNR